MKQYKLVYDKFLFRHLKDHIRYMLYKKFLFWYVPLIVEEHISSPYDRAVDRTEYYMEATSIALIKNFFSRGKITHQSFFREKPTWYVFGKNNNIKPNNLTEEYFNDLDDFLNQKAEYLI